MTRCRTWLESIRRIALTLAVIVTASCGSGEAPVAPPFAVREILSPAPAGSAEPNLAPAGDSIWMTWLEQTQETGHALRAARWDGVSWSPTRTIASGSGFFVNWADFPSLLAMRDGTLVAHWLWRSGDGTYAYDVMVASSGDNGATWSPPERPHRDGTQAEHGFVSLLDLGPGRFAAVWLDGREMAAESESKSGATRLMYAEHTDGGFGPERVLDARVCDCCQTAAAALEGGALVVYRDRSPVEIRDISVVTLRRNTWSQPAPLQADGWEMPGCPVNGPALSVEDGHAVVAWYTGSKDEPKVFVAFAPNADHGFENPVRLDDGKPFGRVDIAWLGEGSALVIWLEGVDGGGAEVRARRVHPVGRIERSFVVAPSTSARSSGFPRLARAGREILVAWTDVAEPSRVRVARFAASPEAR